VLFFFIPHEGVGIWYFAFWYAILFLAWTVIEIPTLAWQIELSKDYRTRTQIAATRFAFGTVGSICFFLVPLLPIFSSTRFTPETLQWIAWATVIILPITILIAITFAPQGKVVPTPRRKMSIIKSLKAVTITGPARLYFTAVAFIGLALGMALSSFFLYVDAYMGLGDKIAFLWTIPSIIMLAFLPVWTYLCMRFNRHKMWAISTILGSFFMLMVFFIAPGPASFLPYLILLCLFQVASAAGEIASPGLIGDVVDHNTLVTGVNKAGQFTSVSLLIIKISTAVGTALGFYQLKFFGFDPTSDSHDAMAALGIKLTVSGIPAVIFVIAALIIWNFPITKQRQHIIKKRLEQLASRGEPA